MADLEASTAASRKQFGFTQGRSTNDANVELVQQIFGAWEKSLDRVGVFCDLSKAFDCVSKVFLGFELLLALKHNARRLFIIGLQNSSAVVSVSVTNVVMVARPPL
ncbi:hypothetical protein EVAR_38147_1 [Eumeta japonica]|uniref:Reverse transcriptase domain-containing protein n=1 Tax=Eumeta variegata TaxID=151549 RepID=A0A4C1YRR9_EUMVA|nr:hypothetical protein EVAR_38147_1 [Eumeta japonica]